MPANNKLKIINDPIYGFITIPNELIFNLIQHPYFQRLRRISQMGLSYLVYPGAHHTRFHHALGGMFLMQKAIQVLRFKKVTISSEEENALLIAILLHDIGHGPFSHAMEHSIVQNVSHEELSLYFMELLNEEFNQELDVAIQIFKGEYERKFMCQLISSQLDMDRADYLKRDSFYTGVAEGNINSERLISMFNVVENTLVVEVKGIYSVEKFLLARRLMYWQVYLHKTSLVAEQLLIRVLKRAKDLSKKGVTIKASEPLRYFLNQKIDKEDINKALLNRFALLDDFDVYACLKDWQFHEDFVLSTLSGMILNRRLLKIKLKSNKISSNTVDEQLTKVMQKYKVSEETARYFVFTGTISNQAYEENTKNIKILYKNGKTKDITEASELFNLKALSKPVTKFYICYPKAL